MIILLIIAVTSAGGFKMDETKPPCNYLSGLFTVTLAYFSKNVIVECAIDYSSKVTLCIVFVNFI